MARISRRDFVAGLSAFWAFPYLASAGETSGFRPVKFLFMTDHHVEHDFVERGHPVYESWSVGDHAGLEATYRFISTDPYCRDCDFALFGGDQLNTGYTYQQAELDAERKTYFRTLQALDLHAKTDPGDLASFRFVAEPYFVRENLPRGMKPFKVDPPPLASRVIALQGNHDTGVEQFYRSAAFTCRDTRIITFFTEGNFRKNAEGKWVSTPAISDETLAFLEREMAAAAADPAIDHIVVASHFAIAEKGRGFIWPIEGPSEGNGMNDNRRRFLELAEKYGCDLYINGHEHNCGYPTAKAGPLTDINCGTAYADPLDPKMARSGAFAIFEMHSDKAIVNIYSRAGVRARADGSVEVVRPPARVMTRVIPLRPIHGKPESRGELKARFGVLSDLHVAEPWTQEKFERALRWYDAHQADAVLVCGDLTDWGLVNQLKQVGETWRRVFPDNRRSDGQPIKPLFHYGDHDSGGYAHDHYGSLQKACRLYGLSEDAVRAQAIRTVGVEKAWEDAFGEPYEPIAVREVKGFTFVLAQFTVGEPGNKWGNNTPGAEQLLASLKLDPAKPFFYSQHRVYRGALGDEGIWGQDDGRSTRLLAQYPNCVAFCGHAHRSCDDERMFRRGDFTAVEVPSLKGSAWLGADGKRVEKDTRGECQGLFVRVYERGVEISRLDLATGRKLGEDWTA